MKHSKMNSFIAIAAVIVFLFLNSIVAIPFVKPFRSTAERIKSFNYPVETHKVTTSDGYLLTLFRIPSSPKLRNENQYRPAVLLVHGFLSSSDCWILAGPDSSLAYVLADAGYDVWMTNARGNIYSNKNIRNSSIANSLYWDFTWHEVALYDIPATIDYILEYKSDTALHYVGHSQGTTVYFAFLSMLPSYNAKMKTSHMLAPIVYEGNTKSPVFQFLSPLLGNPSLLPKLIGTTEFMPNEKLLDMLGSKICKNASPLQPACADFLFLLNGWDPIHLNYTLLPDLFSTHPAGSSTKQLIHFLQIYKSGKFRQFDYGRLKNKEIYCQFSPPEYNLKNIVAPVTIYYGENDYFSDIEDIQELARQIPNLLSTIRMPFPEWNHLDFVVSLEMKDVLYKKIIETANHFERTGEQLVL